jgi:hypothetical protein
VGEVERRAEDDLEQKRGDECRDDDDHGEQKPLSLVEEGQSCMRVIG